MRDAAQQHHNRGRRQRHRLRRGRVRQVHLPHPGLGPAPPLRGGHRGGRLRRHAPLSGLAACADPETEARKNCLEKLSGKNCYSR